VALSLASASNLLFPKDEAFRSRVDPPGKACRD
jgi:hypothetical protein